MGPGLWPSNFYMFRYPSPPIPLRGIFRLGWYNMGRWPMEWMLTGSRRDKGHGGGKCSVISPRSTAGAPVPVGPWPGRADAALAPAD